jgi:hypothetical protein
MTPISFFSKETLITLMDSHVNENNKQICLSDYLYNIIYEKLFKKPKLGIFLLDNSYFSLDDDVSDMSLCDAYEYPNIKEFIEHLESLNESNTLYLIYSISRITSDDLFHVRGRVIEDYQIYNNAIFKKHKLDRRKRIIDKMFVNPSNPL